VAAASQATRELVKLNQASPAGGAGPLAKSLVRSEAAASSRIEGLQLSQQRLARAAYQAEGHRGDRRAAEILANVEALEQAVVLGADANPIGVTDIQDIHRTLLRFTFDRAVAGVVRDRQSWIGGSDYHPLDAAYVPPPAEYVPALLEDLCEFIERDDLAPVVQAAIAHAQFETIHPFADGNGRVGRALIHTVLRRRGETPEYVPPISLVLAAQPRAYIAGLVDYREGRISDWCTLFTSATARAADDAIELNDAIAALQARWLDALGSPRRDAAVRQIVAVLPSQPVIDVGAAQHLTGKSHVAVGNALNQLEDAGILQRLNERKWGRLWECGELLQLVSDFEERVSTPPA
jgi:Fic family protein